MGMFDNVVCEYPLPDEIARRVVEWQTKDFDHPFLWTYRITPEGRLLKEEVHYEDRSDPTAPADSILSLRGCMTPVHDGWKDTEYHGVLNFYGFANEMRAGEEWVEYNATFTHGQLEKIERVPDPYAATSPVPNAVTPTGEQQP